MAWIVDRSRSNSYVSRSYFWRYPVAMLIHIPKVYLLHVEVSTKPLTSLNLRGFYLA